ncbi:hypothetical protein LCGC14_2489620, partial [marine sediment metagenome]
MVAGVLTVKGDDLSILAFADSAEQLISGATTGSTPTGWNFKVKGTYLHWVDNDGDERRALGSLTGNTGLVAGVVNGKGEAILYVDFTGAERSLTSEPSVVIDTGSAVQGVIVRTSASTLWALYVIGAVLYAKSSTDDGVTWSAADTVATESYSGTDGIQFDAAVNSTGDIEVIYTVRVGA